MADPDVAFGAHEDLEQRGGAHAVLDSRTEATLSRTPAPGIREGVRDVRSLLLVGTTAITG